MISNNHLTYAQSVLLLSSVFMTNSVMKSSTLCDIGGVKVKPAHFRIVYILSFHGHHCLNRLCLFFKGTFFATLVVFMSTYELKQNKKKYAIGCLCALYYPRCKRCTYSYLVIKNKMRFPNFFS